MPRRLPVVVSQGPTANAQRRDLEESLVSALLMERGIDVTVIPHIEDLEPGETGLLCLEGVTGPVVVLAWMTPRAVVEALSAKGIPGRLGRTIFRNDAPHDDSPGRPIYAIDLREVSDTADVVDEVRRIHRDLATPTVALLNPMGHAAEAAPVRPSHPPPDKPVTDRVASPSPTVVTGSVPDAVSEQVESEDDEADRQLDALLDRFDALDI